MTPEWSAIAIFCEDIREEKSGQDTLVGILPDNLRVASVPGMMPKLAVYVRIHVLRAARVREVNVRLEMLDGTFAPVNDLTEVLARDAGTSESIGLLAKTLISPFPVTATGRVKAIATVDGTDYVCGSLTIEIDEQEPT